MKKMKKNPYKFILRLLIPAVFSTQWVFYGCSTSTLPVEIESLNTVYDCETSKEFITTFNFLISTNHIGIGRQQAQKVAARVSEGCTGSALRFIKVTTLLAKAKLSANNIISIATSIAKSDDEVANSFVQIFKMAFLKKYLDLDALSSTKMALDLSRDYPGNPVQSLNDYEHILKFCLARDGLRLAKPTCGKLALRISSYGKDVDGDIGKSYVENIKFLTSKDGPELALFDARKIAESLAKITPFAGKNFLELYKFAISKKGLSLGRSDAVNFAKKLAKNVVKIKTAVKINSTHTQKIAVKDVKPSRLSTDP